MKKTMRFLSMAALALVGAVMTGCSSDDNIIDTPQPENGLVLKTTISLDGGSTTRAVTPAGVKTFAADDQVVLFYKDGKGISRRVVSSALTAGDITNGGKTATLTFDVSASLPATNGAIRYVYPANMASDNANSEFDLDDAHTIDFTKLNAQNGTLATLGSSLDLCVFDGNFSGTSLPATAPLTNRLAILGITLNEASDITNTITRLAVSDGTNSYTVTRSAVAGPIYVAILPTASATIKVTATDGTYYYNKTLTGKSYARNNGYNVTWTMTKLPVVDLSTAGYTLYVTEDAVITGTPSKDDISIDCKDDCEVIL